MTDRFRAKTRAALANPGLQAALDGNAERRRNSRHSAYATLPEDLQSMRQRAHEVRTKTIANLEHYLEQFINNARQNGLTVHRAADGEQAVGIVRKITQKNQARLISKSKTMVGEEIHINQALEADGIEVVETDLGEYIVQLRQEPPAHIITPAVHLSRRDVGETFHEKLGVPLTEDIPTLTAIARRVLRQNFMDADIGISGVNFGVAESGALCLVTNEGNGRMVTSLPEVHIALMGIERLVPTLEDLSLMLYLLPRSATGQQLTVYTSLIHGPRRSGELDGALERHLILIDNGRSAMRDSPLADALYCIRCGACLNVCPVFREIGGHTYTGTDDQYTPYPGPIGSIVSPGLFGQASFGHLARASSLCGACKEACPVDIDLPQLLLRVRAGGVLMSPLPPQERVADVQASHAPRSLRAGLSLYTRIATSPGLFSTAQRLAGIFSRLVSPRSEWLHLPAFTGWGYSRDFPRPASRPFRDLFTAAQGKPLGEQGHTSDAASSATTPAPPQSDKTIPAAPVERFEAELLALSGTFTLIQENEAAQRVIDLLRELEIFTIQAWDENNLPNGLLDALRQAGVQVHHNPDPLIQAGLTSALAAVAETGTLVLHAGEGRPQTASLLPEVHIAILRAEDIYPRLVDVLDLDLVRSASVVNLISGPSRTADIEMTLTIGVHGPGELHVFCLESDP